MKTGGLKRILGCALLATLWGCATGRDGARAPRGIQEAFIRMEAEKENIQDIHSFSRPAEVRVVHAWIAWSVDFDARRIDGAVTWTFERERGAEKSPLILDTKGLDVRAVQAGTAERMRPLEHVDPAEQVPGDDRPAWCLGGKDEVLGRPLVIQPGPGDDRVRIEYRTGPESAGLQWLDPAQTASGNAPYLFTQAQAILARTFIPCQDTPRVRFTFDARIETPVELRAVMAARNVAMEEGLFRFSMPQAVPSYLLAFAVGDITFQSMGPRTGVFAEPEVCPRAANEFADTEAMIEATEKVFGPYRWERFDILVLPPSFPFGGMENPRLTFATPTILAGDRSLVSLVAHELAHSWSGNLVTNASWSDLWLNEGFTVYLERRIMEIVYGEERARMEAVLGFQDLQQDLNELPPPDTVLHVDLRGRDPDDVFSNIPYEKGYLFLRTLEEAVGRERFDPFLRSWFSRNAFQSRTAGDFEAYLLEELFGGRREALEELRVREWIHEPGLPDNAPVPHSEALEACEREAAAVAGGSRRASELPAREWTWHEWVHFLRHLPEDLPASVMAELDEAWHLTRTGNSEILMQWLLQAIRSRYQAADEALERFLCSQGRRKFLKPLYKELARTPEGRKRALEIYSRARSGYHAISTGTIDSILNWDDRSRTP